MIDVFNDMVVARYDTTNNIIKYIKVPVKFAPKTKQWYWTELRDNKDRRDQIFPIISIDLENVEYAGDRQVNRNIRIPALNDGHKTQYFYNPVPYDFIFKVQVAAEYIIDESQIIEQILPFFTPENFIRITIPELDVTGLSQNGEDGSSKLDLRVVYDGSQNDMPVELDEAGYRILLWTHTFKVHGYLFSPIFESGVVNKIIQSYYVDESSWNERLTDVNNEYFQNGKAIVQGVTYATGVPENGVHIDDTIRGMWRYEHYPRECSATLYTVPLTTNYTIDTPLSIELKSNTAIREIWYTLIERSPTYIINDANQLITLYDKYVVMTENDITHPMVKYWTPIVIDTSSMKTYELNYMGVCLDGKTTPLFSGVISPSLPPVV